MARGSAGATLVVMTDDLDHGHRATSRLYRLLVLRVAIALLEPPFAMARWVSCRSRHPDPARSCH